jgi:acyl transferase domain-containing protein
MRLRDLSANHSAVETPPSIKSLSLIPPTPTLKLANGSLKEWVLSRPRLLVWSAADGNGIDRLAKSYTEYFQNLQCKYADFEILLERLAYTLGERRTSLPWKSFAVINSMSQLSKLSEQFSKAIYSTLDRKLGFIFTGQGAQWPGMGKELLLFPNFKLSLEDANSFFQTLGSDWDVLRK